MKGVFYDWFFSIDIINDQLITALQQDIDTLFQNKQYQSYR